MTLDDEQDKLAFRPEFVARVLDAAEALRRRRRLVLRWTGAAAAVLVLTAAAGLGIRPRLALQQPQVEAVPELIASMNALSAGPETRSEPLDFMFPDAEPLARFSDRYSRSGLGATRNDNVIFADEAEESDGD